jgi:hypoxanthine phosphoribosyltransferase
MAPQSADHQALPVRPLITAADIERRVAELAAAIEKDYGPLLAAGDAATSGLASPPAGGASLLVVGVLKGSVFFLTDLVRRLRLPLALDFVQATSYGEGGAVRGELRLTKDLDLAVAGRHLLLVEDIVDSGHTARLLVDLLRSRGARSVRLCALLDKPAARQVEVTIDYRGFAIDNVFVVGYGLDYDERCRNLPYIAVWEPEAATR